MNYLVLGLALFLGIHSVRIFADSWRNHTINRVGEATYKGIYTVTSLAGFVLVVYGFGAARENPVVLWMPPTGLRHLAALLTLGAFVLLAAAYVPRNAIKARLHHPMVLGVKTWALAHLLATGQLVHLVLFGAFLLWAVADFVSLKRRDRINAVVYPPGTLSRTVATVVVGALVWAAFAFHLHGWLIGIRPIA